MTGPFAVDPARPSTDRASQRSGAGRSWALLWIPGLAVALGSAVATAHGLYEVAVAARVPTGVAWIYPLITDGLALVAYAATARLHGSAARYAWSVVVLAAGLSGLAQAVYLASDPAGPDPTTAALAVGPALRFGVGAWPAAAAAIVAHLLYLLAVADGPASNARSATGDVSTGQPSTVLPSNLSDAPHRTPVGLGESDPDRTTPALADRPASDPAGPAAVLPAAPIGQPESDALIRGGDSPVRDRARAAAARHAARHGALPTVRELMALADVSRGSAADALKQLRDQPTALHLVPDSDRTSTQP